MPCGRCLQRKAGPPIILVIVHVAEAGQIDQLAADVPATAKKLAAAFWPGPMTLVLGRSERVSELATGGFTTVGLRVPSHPALLQKLLRAFGDQLRPSANRFGRVSRDASGACVWEELGRVDLILDAGPCDVGLESTIIDLSGPSPAIVRLKRDNGWRASRP